MLKQCCQNHLRVNASRHLASKESSSKAAKQLRQQLKTSLPFLEYASQNILYHANEAASQISQDHFLDDLVFEHLVNAMNLFEQYEVRRYGPDVDIIYVLAERNFTQLLRTAAPPGTKVHKFSRGGRFHFPLIAALVNDHREAVRVLLQSNEEITYEPDAWYRLADRLPPILKRITPLIWTIERGLRSISAMLAVSNEIEPDSQTTQGRTALSLAAEAGFGKIVDLLQTVREANVNLTDEWMRTPLSYAAEFGRGSVVWSLMGQDALTTPDRDKQSPLMYAALRGHLDVVERLLEYSPKVGEGDPAWLTQIPCPIGSEPFPVGQTKSSDVHAREELGRDALRYAVAGNNPAVVHLLLNSNFSVHAKDNSGGKALFSLPHSDFFRKGTADLLRKYGDDLKAATQDGVLAFSAAEHRDSPMNRIVTTYLLLKHGADLEATTNYGITAFHSTVASGNEDLIRLLAYVGVNIEATDRAGETALMRAVDGIDRGITELLLKLGADIEAKDLRGRTPLSHAIALYQYYNDRYHERRILDEIKTFLAHGARLNAQDQKGRTPLSYGVQTGSDVLVQLLIEAGADVNLADDKSVTPLMWALRRDVFYKVADVLERLQQISCGYC